MSQPTENATVRLVLAFKRVDDSVKMISDIIRRVGVLTKFNDQANLERFLVTSRETFASLISTQAIDRIDVQVDGEILQLNLDYHNGYGDTDNLDDLSLFELVPIEAGQLDIVFFAKDAKFAQFVGLNKLEKLSNARIRVLARPLQKDVESAKHNGGLGNDEFLPVPVERVKASDIIDLLDDTSPVEVIEQ